MPHCAGRVHRGRLCSSTVFVPGMCTTKNLHKVDNTCTASFNWMGQLVPQSCSSSARRNLKRWVIMNVSAVDHVMAKFN